MRLGTDLDHDGRCDQWTYMDGPRAIRSEIDRDGDNRIERWEYLDAKGGLVAVGASSASDGVEDTWSWAVDDKNERLVELSRARDRVIDRREHYRGDDLVRAEEDGNADGRPDKWELYDGGLLREVRLDTTRSRGRPDRRLLYDAEGKYVGIEADPDGDGTFAPLAGPPRR